MSFNFSLDELFSENWNILLWGNGTTANVQSGATITDELTNAPILLDRSIFTVESEISALTVDGTGGTPTYTLNTDYELALAIVKSGVHPIIEHDNPGAVGTFKIN